MCVKLVQAVCVHVRTLTCMTEACAGCVCVYTYVYDRQKLVQAVSVCVYLHV